MGFGFFCLVGWFCVVAVSVAIGMWWFVWVHAQHCFLWCWGLFLFCFFLVCVFFPLHPLPPPSQLSALSNLGGR